MITLDIGNIYKKVCDEFPQETGKPVIGITGNYKDGATVLNEGYYTSILEAGGIPLVIPPFDDHQMIVEVLEKVDALVFSGGADVNPLFVGEEPSQALGNINAQRDYHELMLCKLALNRQIPILGICRGMQLLNLACGGTVFQDIYADNEKKLLQHDQKLDKRFPSHTVVVEEGSLMHQLFGERIYVNSFHHQAVKEVACGFRTTAVATDGIIEAMESTEFKPIVGVQWHPECFIQNGNKYMMPLFHWIVEQAQFFSKAKAIHNNMLIVDSHCDTPMFFHQDITFHHRDERIKVDLHKMSEGKQDVAFMVAYLPRVGLRKEDLQFATRQANEILTAIENMVQKCNTDRERLVIATSVDELYRNKIQKKKSLVLGIENGFAIGDDISLIKHFYHRGVRYMTLCHNGNNLICGSARYNEEGLGLTDFGKSVVQEMNKVGMAIDLSHAGEQSFYDVLEWSKAPVVCSHSSAKALCDHSRNLTDDQLRAIAQKGGVVQVCLYKGFLSTDREATIQDVILHLKHMIQIMGIEHVGIGTDFDGDGGVIGCNDSSELINLTRELLIAGFTPEELRLIWGENFLRVLTEIDRKKTIDS